MTTLEDLMRVVRECNGRAAVYTMLEEYLRARYLPRDSMLAQAKVSTDTGSVPEYLVEEVAESLEKQAKSLGRDVKAMSKKEIA